MDVHHKIDHSTIEVSVFKWYGIYKLWLTECFTIIKSGAGNATDWPLGRPPPPLSTACSSNLWWFEGNWKLWTRVCDKGFFIFPGKISFRYPRSYQNERETYLASNNKFKYLCDIVISISMMCVTVLWTPRLWNNSNKFPRCVSL